MAPSRTPRGRPRASLDGAVDTPLSPRLASTKARTSSSRGSLMGLGESSEEPSELQDGTHYSTPATSTFTTPAPTEPAVKPATRKRGRRVVKEDSDDEDMDKVAGPLHPTERAAALRNSRYSNVPKRKRTAQESDNDDDEEDHSRDAQVARALQKQEDAAAHSMWPESGSGLRRTPRKLQKLFPTPIDEDFDDSDDPLGSRLTAKRPMVELKSSGANAVSLPAMIPDSDQTEDFMEIDDSEALSAFEEDSAWETSDAEDAALPEIKKEKPKPKPKPKAAARRIQTPSLPVRSAIDLTGDDDELDSLALDSDDDDSRPTRDDHLGLTRRGLKDRLRLEMHHPELLTMWSDLENLPKIGQSKIDQPKNITRQLKPFQLEGVAWMKAMEKTDWGGGLLGDEMGMGKTIQAVTLIMSDWPAKQPTLVLMPPVALMQWQQEIAAYTDGTLKTFVHHGTNARAKGVSVAELKKYDVILMSYNSLESAYRKQTKGFQRKDGLFKEKSAIHQIQFHRVILDEAHSIKSRTSGSAKACFALKADHKWCLSGTPLQNRIGEFFSLVRFLEIQPFACYMCKQCTCTTLNWAMNGDNRCSDCNHSGMHHVSVFNQELLNPIMKFGNEGRGKVAFGKLRLLTDRFMLRRVKVNHSSAMELPAKEIYVDRQFFGEVENDFAGSIMNNSRRKFETYVDRGVMLNNYANIFGLIMQMRQVADHPDLILKKDGEGGQNVLVCCICDETAEDAIRSQCRHEFCRVCAKDYLRSSDEPDCPTCHIPLAIDLEQPEIAQDEQLVKKSSIINRIDMKSWTSSSKIETLVHDLHELRSKNMSHKSIIFSQFTTMLQLVEWRLRRAGITTVMLDGSMTPAQRQASINHFMTDPDVECFLVSLKAGGVALNLTEASQVFIVDPWWNPAAEWQSADRCHRIGQGRPCSITRLCIEDSVESRMVLLQEKKANMIHSTINADAAAMENLTIEDMQFLFRGS